MRGVGAAQRPQGRYRDEQVADLQRAQDEKGGSPVVRHAAPVPAPGPSDPARASELIVRVAYRRQVARRSSSQISRVDRAGDGRCPDTRIVASRTPGAAPLRTVDRGATVIRLLADLFSGPYPG